MLMVPTALLELKEVLVASSSVKFDLGHVATVNGIPPLATASFQGGSDLRRGRLPFWHEDHRSVAAGKDVVLLAAL